MKIKSSGSKATLFSLTTILVATSGTMAPVQSGWAIDEITVTTRRTEENAQDIPIAVNAIDNASIERQAITSTKDVVKLIPGVQFDQSFASSDTRITIRGINNSRGRASAATLVDGIDISGENVSIGGGGSLLNLDLLDLERVEVIKGPQSALYGRNAFAGAINYITKKPSMDETVIEIGGEIAEEGGYRAKAAVSGPVIDNVLALRFNVATSGSDGFYNNNLGPSQNPSGFFDIDPGNTQDLNGFENKGARLAALWTPSETLNIEATLSYSEQEQDQRAVAKSGVPNVYYDFDGNELPAGTAPDFSAGGVQGYGQWLGTIDTIPESAVGLSNTGDGREFPGSEDERWQATFKVEKELEYVVVKSITSYLENDATVEEDVDFQNGLGTFFSGAGLSVATDYVDETETEQFSQEFIVESKDWSRGRWLVGTQIYSEDVENIDNSVGWYNDPAIMFGIPCGSNVGTAAGGFFDGQFACSFEDASNLTVGGVTSPLDPKVIIRDTESFSLFGLVSYDFTEKLTGTFEARFIRDDIEVTTNTLIDRVSQYLLHIPGDLEQPGAVPTSDTVTTKTINPRVAFDYEINDDSMIYFSAAKGTKPGGFGTSQMSTPQDARMEEEELLAYEIGSKNVWLDGNLRANFALFYNDYKDRQVGVTSIDEISGLARAGIVNAGSAETKGVEIDLTWSATENLTLGLGYAYTDAEFDDFDFAEIRARAGRELTEKDKAICGNAVGNCDGAEVSGVAEDALTLVGNYTAPFGNAGLEWFVNANARYLSERPLANQVFTPFVDSSWIADTQIGIQSDRWSVMIFADNVFDDDTVQWAQVTSDFKDGMYGGSFGGEPRDDAAFAFLPDPRIVGLRASYSFGL